MKIVLRVFILMLIFSQAEADQDENVNSQRSLDYTVSTNGICLLSEADMRDMIELVLANNGMEGVEVYDAGLNAFHVNMDLICERVSYNSNRYTFELKFTRPGGMSLLNSTWLFKKMVRANNKEYKKKLNKRIKKSVRSLIRSRFPR